eukprot:2476240-Rhodomonas_salina.4
MRTVSITCSASSACGRSPRHRLIRAAKEEQGGQARESASERASERARARERERARERRENWMTAIPPHGGGGQYVPGGGLRENGLKNLRAIQVRAACRESVSASSVWRELVPRRERCVQWVRDGEDGRGCVSEGVAGGGADCFKHDDLRRGSRQRPPRGGLLRALSSLLLPRQERDARP